MKSINFIGILILSFLLLRCAPLLPATTIKNSPIETFKYIYISPTKILTSTTGGVYGGAYGVFGSTQSKSVNPTDVISGILTKKGFIRLIEQKDLIGMLKDEKNWCSLFSTM